MLLKIYMRILAWDGTISDIKVNRVSNIGAEEFNCVSILNPEYFCEQKTLDVGSYLV